VNDTVVTSGTLGRMIELGYSIDGEDLGVQPCDGLICSTPSGSTAYNLSNGGPVLVWGLEAMVTTFVAPHTLHARPLVVGPETELVVVNRSIGVSASVLIDGHPVSELAPGERAVVRFGRDRSLLATLPERTFFHRYADVFGAG
jgi:NAD+ kinase